MPQADILSFRATLLLLPVIFLLGYYFFATFWVPRLLLTLKARSWLTRVEASVWPVIFYTGDQWPELFLMFVQFGGLVWVISKVSLSGLPGKLPGLVPVSVHQVDYPSVGGAPIENFFHLWGLHRQALFFAPAGAALTSSVVSVLQSFSFYTPGKQFPFLLARLRQQLPTVVSELVDTQQND